MCKVYDNQNGYVLSGYRSLDNCYKINQFNHCQHITTDSKKLWHKRLARINYQDLTKLVNAGCVKGVPKLSSESIGTCSACKTGKEIRSTHKDTNGLGTNRMSELLRMDLMGLGQVESLGGKSNVVLCMDDFSRYT